MTDHSRTSTGLLLAVCVFAIGGEVTAQNQLLIPDTVSGEVIDLNWAWAPCNSCRVRLRRPWA
ncbi:MAG: hypothetical protein IPN38_17910 [Flavobacteriales bacterium]|nr:hypothetical protein [Flavobacteriales bacterium]